MALLPRDEKSICSVIVEDLCRIATEAGKKILEVRHRAIASVQFKADQSPVTEADLIASDFIVSEISKLSSDPIVSEEAIPEGDLGPRFWLVDPLDGTKDFVAGKPSFVVSIGLVEEGKPILGVIYAPVTRELYWAERGKGAFKGDSFAQGVRVQHQRQGDSLRALASGSWMSPRLKQFLDLMNVTQLDRYGSALKLCRMAEGLADIYPRFGDTSEWDTAAGHVILNEAGGKLLDIRTGRELLYGKPNFLNNGFFAVGGEIDIVARLPELLAIVGQKK